MKKILSALLALTMLLALTACGGSGGGGGTTSGGGGDSTKPEVKGETTEVGDFSVLVPEGWLGHAFSNTTNSYQIYKGAKDDSDKWSTPCVQIRYWKNGDDSMLDKSKNAYKDVKDIDPVTIGDYTWKGFTGTNSDKPVTYLYSVEAGPFGVAIYTEVNGKTISLEDADFQAIMASLKVTQK